MVDLKEHQKARVVQLVAHHGNTEAELLEAMRFDLGENPTQGAVTGWLWEQLVDAGLELRSDHRDPEEAIAAWQAIEDGEGPQGALTLEQFRAIVECGKPRNSSVRLTWGDE